MDAQLFLDHLDQNRKDEKPHAPLPVLHNFFFGHITPLIHHGIG